MRIGIDFDNTIVCYDDVFYRVALKKGIIQENTGRTKTAVKEKLISTNHEDLWTELQGLVYGEYISEADPYSGVKEFLSRMGKENFDIFIISHRSKYPYIGRKTDLHSAADRWLRDNDFFDDTPIDSSNVFFETTVVKKIDRVKKQRCEIFIDDLPSLFLHSGFPESIRKILFLPKGKPPLNSNLEIARSWSKILGMIVV